MLKKGSKGPRVVQVQRALKLPADGVFGPATRRAVKAFQRRHGLTADGIVGPATMAKLTRGGGGGNVKTLQRALGIAADGIFGPGTQAAVKQFQRRNGLTPDGIVGPATWAELGFPGVKKILRRKADPSMVAQVIAAADRIATKPYRYGGGHRRWRDSGYDCSGLRLLRPPRRRAPVLPPALGRLPPLRQARTRPLHHDLRQPRPHVHGRQRPPLRHERRQAARHPLDGRAPRPERLRRAASSRPMTQACRRIVESRWFDPLMLGGDRRSTRSSSGWRPTSASTATPATALRPRQRRDPRDLRRRAADPLRSDGLQAGRLLPLGLERLRLRRRRRELHPRHPRERDAAAHRAAAAGRPRRPAAARPARAHRRRRRVRSPASRRWPSSRCCSSTSTG